MPAFSSFFISLVTLQLVSLNPNSVQITDNNTWLIQPSNPSFSYIFDIDKQSELNTNKNIKYILLQLD